MKFLIIHGLGGTSEGNWFPWLKKELENLGHEVIVPDFPNSMNPDLNEWLEHLKNFDFDENTIFIAHSLGVPFTLHILEKFKLKSVFLVAGFCSLLDSRFNDYLSSFVDGFDWEKIKDNCNQFYVINSEDDDYVPLSKGEELATHLNTKVNMINGDGHFMIPKFIELLEMIKEKL